MESEPFGGEFQGGGDPSGLTLREMERRHILSALTATDWKVSGPVGAAERPGLKPATVESCMKRLGLGRNRC